jgi:hypothetical protein
MKVAPLKIVNLPSINGFTANAACTATVDIPIGPTYHVIWITGNAGTGKKVTDLITEIRIKLNGKTQRMFSADQLNKLNILNGSRYACIGGGTNAAAFNLPLFFAEPWRDNPLERERFAWGTNGLSTFQIEIDCAATAANATLGAKAEVANSSTLDNHDDNNAQPGLGPIVKYGRLIIPVSATGWMDFNGFPKRDFYQQITFITTALDEFEIKVGSEIIRQDTKVGNEARLTSRGLVPIPTATATPANLAADIPTRGMIDVVFDYDDPLNSALAMNPANGQRVQDFNVRLNVTAGTSVPFSLTALFMTVGAAD